MSYPTSVKIEGNCKACNYHTGNLIKLHGKRYAVKCGGCDCYQYTIVFPQALKGRAAR